MKIDDYKTEIREEFRMIDPRYTLELVVSRGCYNNTNAERMTLTSALYATLRPTSAERSLVKMRTSMWLSTFEGVGLENVFLTMTHVGVDLKFAQNDIDGIHREERDRVHALLQELRGVEYQFTADLFGFLKKDGSDEKQKFTLPFPEIETEGRAG